MLHGALFVTIMETEVLPPEKLDRRKKENRQLTAEQLQYAKNLLHKDFKTQADAYRSAFGKDHWQLASIRAKAGALAAHPGIKKFLAEAKRRMEIEAAKDAVSTRLHVAQSLRDIADDDAIAPSVRVRALELMGKSVGMFDAPRAESPIPDSEAEINAEIEIILEAIN